MRAVRGESIFAGYTTTNRWWISPPYKNKPLLDGSYYKSDPTQVSWSRAAGTDRIIQIQVSPAVIPEPSTLIIWPLLGILGSTIAWWRRR